MPFTPAVLGQAHSLLLPFLFLPELSGAKQQLGSDDMHREAQGRGKEASPTLRVCTQRF